MAYSYTNNGITFNNLPAFDKTTMKKYQAIHMYANNYANAETDGIEPFINAVEIDWNSATLGDKFINLFGEVGCSILVPFGC